MDEHTKVIIDGNWLYYTRAAQNRTGGAHSGIYGTLESLSLIHRRFGVAPREVVFCFDSDGSLNARRKLSPFYKILRAKRTCKKCADYSCAHCLVWAQKRKLLLEFVPALQGMGYQVVQSGSLGVEADDVIIYLASASFTIKDVFKIIVSGDKDLWQVFHFCRNASVLANVSMTSEVVFNCKKLQILNKQIFDYYGICGDKIDKIPGIEGLGHRTAVSWLRDPDWTPTSIEKRLRGKNRDDFILSRELFRYQPPDPLLLQKAITTGAPSFNLDASLAYFDKYKLIRSKDYFTALWRRHGFF